MVTLAAALKPLLRRPIALLGMGISGQAVDRLLHHLQVPRIRYDSKQGSADRTTFGPSDLAQHSLAIYSPGFPPDHPWLSLARQQNCTCMSELDFASFFWPGPLIGITGTNGKTSLTEFLAFALRRGGGRDAIAVGNNGRPLASIIQENGTTGIDTTAVCEISSFQAETLQNLQLDALLWTNFADDHLDRHSSVQNYFLAKAKLIGRLRRPALFLGKSVLKAAEHYRFNLPRFAQCVPGPDEREDGMDSPAPAAGVFDHEPQKENFLLARSYWLSQRLPEKELYQDATHFSFPPHRLSKVASIAGIHFWNDSKATNFAATLAALKRFSQPVVWLGGGRSKGEPIEPFIQTLTGEDKKAKNIKKVKAAFLLGEAAPELAKAFESTKIAYQISAGVEEAVRSGFAHAQTGDHILFSPGFSSYDSFADFAERGGAFVRTVKTLKS